MAKNTSKLHALNFGLAGGIVTGLCIFLTTIMTAVWGLFPLYTSIIEDIYGFIGFSATVGGAFLGAVYGFIDGFIAVWVFALIYNKLQK